MCVCASVTRPFALFSRTRNTLLFTSLSNASPFRFLSNDWICVCQTHIDYTQTHTHAHVKADALESLERIYIQLMKWIRFWSLNPSFKAHTHFSDLITPHGPLIRPTFIAIVDVTEYVTIISISTSIAHCTTVRVCWVEREMARACGCCLLSYLTIYWQWNGGTVRKKGVDTFWVCESQNTHSLHFQSAYMHKMPDQLISTSLNLITCIHTQSVLLNKEKTTTNEPRAGVATSLHRSLYLIHFACPLYLIRGNAALKSVPFLRKAE